MQYITKYGTILKIKYIWYNTYNTKYIKIPNTLQYQIHYNTNTLQYRQYNTIQHIQYNTIPTVQYLQ